MLERCWLKSPILLPLAFERVSCLIQMSSLGKSTLGEETETVWGEHPSSGDSSPYSSTFFPDHGL